LKVDSWVNYDTDYVVSNRILCRTTQISKGAI